MTLNFKASLGRSILLVTIFATEYNPNQDVKDNFEDMLPIIPTRILYKNQNFTGVFKCTKKTENLNCGKQTSIFTDFLKELKNSVIAPKLKF